MSSRAIPAYSDGLDRAYAGVELVLVLQSEIGIHKWAKTGLLSSTKRIRSVQGTPTYGSVGATSNRRVTDALPQAAGNPGTQNPLSRTGAGTGGLLRSWVLDRELSAGQKV